LREDQRFGSPDATGPAEKPGRNSTTTVGCSADGTLVYSGDADGGVRVWERVTGRLVFRKAAHRRSAQAVCVLAGNGRLVTGGEDEAVRVWDLSSGELVASFLCESAPVCADWLPRQGRLCIQSAHTGADSHRN